MVRELRGLQEEQEHPLLLTRTPTQTLTLRILQPTTLLIIITTHDIQTCISMPCGGIPTTPMGSITLRLTLRPVSI